MKENTTNKKGSTSVAEVKVSPLVNMLVDGLGDRMKAFAPKPEVIKRADVEGLVSTLLAMGNLKEVSSRLVFKEDGEASSAQVSEYVVDERFVRMIPPIGVYASAEKRYDCNDLRVHPVVDSRKVLGTHDFLRTQNRLLNAIRGAVKPGKPEDAIVPKTLKLDGPMAKGDVVYNYDGSKDLVLEIGVADKLYSKDCVSVSVRHAVAVFLDDLVDSLMKKS